MRNRKPIGFAAAAGCIVLMAAGIVETRSVTLVAPKNWPPMVYDLTQDPLTAEGIALGRKLFYDAILSKDSTISCGSCHSPYTAFSHTDHKLSHGLGDSIGTRNAPALMNLAWNRHFMWDGAVNHLDMQPLAPITHGAEMGETVPNVLRKLRNAPVYRKAFAEAFGDTMISGEHLLKALAQFQLTLVSAGAKYDRVQAGTDTFDAQEQQGYLLFRSHCNVCHREPLFTTNEFANNGLPPDSLLRDGGRIHITHDAKDSLKFKIPTLRNIEYSHPYMHDGRFRRLREVIAHYTEGVLHSPTLAVELEKPISLSPDERTDLVAFLLTLSDRDFVQDPDHAAPRPDHTFTPGERPMR